MEIEDMHKLMNDIEHVIRCPICLENVSAPILVCENGHGTCQKCRDVSANCSLCQKPFTDVPVRMLEQVIDLLPRPCPFEGCTEQYVQQSHKNICEFRDITCRVGRRGICCWSGNFKDWLEHINKEHLLAHFKHLDFSVERRMSNHCLRRFMPFGFVFVVDRQYFLLLTSRTEKTYKMTITHVPFRKPNCQYYFDVSVKLRDSHEIMYKSKLSPDLLVEGKEQSGGTMEVLLEDVKANEERLTVIFKATKKES